MTEAHKTSSQDEPYPDEDLLQGLEKLTPAFYQHTSPFHDSEDSKSMLLDSINAYTRNSQAMVEEVINEAIEEEQDLTPLRTAHRAPAAFQNEAFAPIMEPDDQETISANQVPCSPTTNYQPAQPVNAIQEEKGGFEETQQQTPLLTSSHYNGKQQDSFGKVDQNSSLFVEYSNQKSMDFSAEESFNSFNAPQQVAHSLNLDESFIANDHQSTPNIRFVEQIIPEVMENQHEHLKPLVIEEERHVEEQSNYSIDSSRLAAMIALQFLPSERGLTNERIDQVEYQYQQSPNQDRKQEQIIEEIQLIPNPSIQIEMPILSAEFAGFKPLDTPLEFQGKVSCDSNPYDRINPIFCDPIREQIIQGQQQQREEEQEMLDSINVVHRQIQIEQPNPYKEFTFGKEGVENSYGQQNEEDLKSLRNVMSEIDPMNQQLGNSIEIPHNQNEQFWNSMRQENAQNLSLNVEHDNNFKINLQDVEEMPNLPTTQLNRENQMDFEPILINIDPIEGQALNQLQVNNYSNREERQFEDEQVLPSIIPQQNIYKAAQEQVQVRSIEPNTQSHQQVNNVFKEPNIIEQVEPKNESIKQPFIFQRHQPKNDQPNFVQLPVSVSAKEVPMHSENILRSIKSYAINNVCNMSLNHDATGTFFSNSHPQYAVYQHSSINNNSANLPFHNSSCSYSHQQIHNQSVSQPSQPTYESKVQVQPWMTISYKPDGASINLFGPLIQSKQEKVTAPTINVSSNPPEIHKKTQEDIQPNPNTVEQKQKVEKISEDLRFLDQLSANSKKSQIKIIEQKLPEKEFADISIQTSCKMKNEVQIIEDVREGYRFVIEHAENYLLAFDSSSESAHKQFEKLVGSYVIMRFTPEPKNEIGIKLFKNGLFLIAMVKLITRSSPTPFIFCYMYEYLENMFGPFIERNNFVFRSQAGKAKKNYQAALQKKYNEMIFSRVQQKNQQKVETVKRFTISHNPFITIQGEKKDTVEQVFIPKEIPPEILTKRQQQIDQREEIVRNVVIVQPEQNISIEEIPKPVPQSSNKNKSKKNEALETPQNVQASAKSQKETKPAEPIVQQTSIKKDKNAENLIKKNIQQIKNSFGSYAKKVESTPDSNTDQNSRFKDLYEKYRKIREDKDDKNKKQGELPIDNSSIKRNLITQILKAENKDQDTDKKGNKKQVGFPEDVIKKDISENQDEDSTELAKKKKNRRRTKSKKDSKDSADNSEQENGIYNKTRKSSQSKKDR